MSFKHNGAKMHPEMYSKNKDLYSVKNMIRLDFIEILLSLMSLMKLKKISLEEIIDPSNKYFLFEKQIGYFSKYQ